MLSSNHFRFHPVVSQSLSSMGSDRAAQVDVHTTPSLYSLNHTFSQGPWSSRGFRSRMHAKDNSDDELTL
jgi:hypothetical protein